MTVNLPSSRSPRDFGASLPPFSGSATLAGAETTTRSSTRLKTSFDSEARHDAAAIDTKSAVQRIGRDKIQGAFIRDSTNLSRLKVISKPRIRNGRGKRTSNIRNGGTTPSKRCLRLPPHEDHPAEPCASAQSRYSVEVDGS